MDVVKNESNIPLGNRGQLLTAVLIRSLPLFGVLSSGLFRREMGDDLRLPIIEEQEVFLVQIPNGVTLSIPHHHAYQHQLDVDLERGSFFVRSNFRRTLIGMRLSGSRILWGRRLHRFRLRACSAGEK